jgi:hypothetical protein
MARRNASTVSYFNPSSRAKLAVDSPLQIPRNNKTAWAGRSCLWAKTVP